VAEHRVGSAVERKVPKNQYAWINFSATFSYFLGISQTDKERPLTQGSKNENLQEKRISAIRLAPLERSHVPSELLSKEKNNVRRFERGIGEHRESKQKSEGDSTKYIQYLFDTPTTKDTDPWVDADVDVERMN
jgi:hypothetical protein